MKNVLKGILLSMFVTAGFSVNAAPAQSAAAEEKAAASQTKPDSPKVAYQRKVQEIRAAHRDNLANCKTGEKTERSACVKEANQILKSDLANAKNLASNSSDPSMSSGSSGASGSTDASSSGSFKDTPNASGSKESTDLSTPKGSAK